MWDSILQHLVIIVDAPNPKHLLRQEIANNLARLFFTLRNKNSLARLFSKVIS